MPWGRITRKDDGPVTRLYLHVFDWPESGKILVPRVDGRVRSCKALAGGGALNISFQNDGILVSLPGQPAHKAATVLVLEVESAPPDPSRHPN